MPTASSGPQRHSRGKTRRRGAALEEALLDAAWDELQAVGYANLTMEAVADRAGTSRAVLYRRWRNRTELVIAATRRHRPRLSGDVPDTGTLRGDVVALLTRASDRLAENDLDTVYGHVERVLRRPRAVLSASRIRCSTSVPGSWPRFSSMPKNEARSGLTSVRGLPPCRSTCSATSCSTPVPHHQNRSSQKSSTTSSFPWFRRDGHTYAICRRTPGELPDGRIYVRS